MHPPLGDHLAVEMRHLLHQPDVLQQCRAARAGGHDFGIVGHRRAGRALVKTFDVDLVNSKVAAICVDDIRVALKVRKA
jgi:hypothetical protein